MTPPIDNAPTPEQMAKQPMAEGSGDKAPWFVLYPTFRALLIDAGFFDWDQQRALDRFELMRYVGTRHLAQRGTKLSAEEIGRELSDADADIPSLRDGYRWCLRHLSRRDMDMLAIAVSELGPNDNLMAMRRAGVSLMSPLDGAATRLVMTLKNFDDERKRLQERMPSDTY